MVKKKAIALLSGGIDSPVAINLMQDKFEIIGLHFHQIPLTDENEREKVKKLAKHLGLKKLYLVAFAQTLKEIVEKCDHRYYYILGKILMYKIGEEIAKKERAMSLITGENLAQVSSQTLSSMYSITMQIDLPILRPVLCCDKQEIVDLAKEIGSYEISKGPEICSLLGPKNPITKGRRDLVEKELSKLDLKKICSICLDPMALEIIEY